jgi:hypothetical protein
MAKKSKKQRAASLSEAVKANAMQAEFRAYDRDFNPDYTDIIKDLKRIGTLAGSFLLLLIILSFFIN